MLRTYYLARQTLHVQGTEVAVSLVCDQIHVKEDLARWCSSCRGDNDLRTACALLAHCFNPSSGVSGEAARSFEARGKEEDNFRAAPVVEAARLPQDAARALLEPPGMHECCGIT